MTAKEAMLYIGQPYSMVVGVFMRVVFALTIIRFMGEILIDLI
jgi:hypothetical protein